MDGQQTVGADADRIVTRSLTPLRRLSAGWTGALLCLGMGLPFVLILSVAASGLGFSFLWVLLGGFGIGAVLYAMGGIGRAQSWAWASLQNECRAEAGRALKAFAAHPLVYWDGGAGHEETGPVCWATGVAWDGQFIYVLNRGVGARIPLPMVREWRWAAGQAGTTGWFAVGNQLDVLQARQQALDHDARNRWRVEAGNGLFLSVRDIDRPTWQFQSSDERTLRRWAEILEQAFEERTAS